MFSSKTDDWETPQDFFDALDAEFNFQLDVCASNANAKCDKYFSKDENGLAQKWITEGGSVWCNPPYGRQISEWVKKASEESKINNQTVVMLVPREPIRNGFMTTYMAMPKFDL